MKAYIIYDEDHEIEGIALNEGEAMYTVWQMLRERNEEKEMEEIADFYGYATVEDMEEDWYNGAFDCEIEGLEYEEREVLNELGLI